MKIDWCWTCRKEHPMLDVQDAYEKVTGLKFDGGDPKVIGHYRLSFYGPPCPYCGRLLATHRAKQCLTCSMDWHDPQNVVCHKGR